MASEKPERSAIPGSLLSQWWSLGALTHEKRARARHWRAAWVILDRYMQARGLGRASVRYIAKATGLSQRSVVTACRELTDWGYTRRIVGSGSRPTEYMPNWVTAPPATTRHLENDVASATPVDSTIATPGGHTNPLSASPVGSESDLLLTGVEAELEVSKAVTAPAPAEGLAAPPGDAGGFERVWRAYERLGNKAASKRAWAALPDPNVAHIVSRAEAWAASAKPGQRRMPLEKWLEQERFDEADRATKPKHAPVDPDDGEPEVARRRTDAAEAANTARAIRCAAIEIAAPRNLPLTVLDAAVEARGSDHWLTLATSGGRVALLLEGGTASLQEQGQAHLARLTYACGLNQVEEPSDLLGCTFTVADDTFAAPIAT